MKQKTLEDLPPGKLVSVSGLEGRWRHDADPSSQGGCLAFVGNLDRRPAIEKYATVILIECGITIR